MVSPEHNVARLVAEVAARLPDQTALIFQKGDRTESISFGRLWADAVAIGASLQKLNIKAGDRVILMIPMSIDLYACLLGIIRIGGVVVFVDPWVGAQQIASFSEFAEPTAFIGINKAHLLRWTRPRLRKIRVSVTNGFRIGPWLARYSLAPLKQHSGPSNVPPTVAPVAPDQSALITFTSGSSGTPKGANRTHRFLLAQHKALKQAFPYKPDDVDMPMFPVFALNNLVTGITSVVPEMDFGNVSAVSGNRILDQMVQHGVTTCTASPPLLDNLADAIERVDASTIARFRLRRILTGGAPVSDNQLRRWKKTFRTSSGETEIIVAYGSTEAEPVAHIGANERLGLGAIGKGFCAGRPVAPIRCMVLPLSDHPPAPRNDSRISLTSRALPQGEIGELVVAGDHVCREYYKNEHATRENKWLDSDDTVWHRMGDTGYFDDQNRFWLVGRLHSTIFRNGHPIHPQIIEQIAQSADASIVRTAAVGIEDATLGEKVIVVAQVAPMTSDRSSSVVASIEQALDQHQQPCDAVLLRNDPFPLDPRHQSKVDYHQLKQWVAQRLDC